MAFCCFGVVVLVSCEGLFLSELDFDVVGELKIKAAGCMLALEVCIT